MNNDQSKHNTCTACNCPCEAHKEHNHPIEEENEQGKDSADSCGCN